MQIKVLENSEVCSVIFNRDYLQFYFEGELTNGTLTTYSLPISVVDGKIYENDTIGYRDSLCSFINRTVKEFQVHNGQKLILIFDNNDRLEVSLVKETVNVPEAAMLRVENQINVW
mgnify:CR=1 FL=1